MHKCIWLWRGGRGREGESELTDLNSNNMTEKVFGAYPVKDCARHCTMIHSDPPKKYHTDSARNTNLHLTNPTNHLSMHSNQKVVKELQRSWEAFHAATDTAANATGTSWMEGGLRCALPPAVGGGGGRGGGQLLWRQLRRLSVRDTWRGGRGGIVGQLFWKRKRNTAGMQTFSKEAVKMTLIQDLCFLLKSKYTYSMHKTNTTCTTTVQSYHHKLTITSQHTCNLLTVSEQLTTEPISRKNIIFCHTDKLWNPTTIHSDLTKCWVQFQSTWNSPTLTSKSKWKYDSLASFNGILVQKILSWQNINWNFECLLWSWPGTHQPNIYTGHFGLWWSPVKLSFGCKRIISSEDRVILNVWL